VYRRKDSFYTRAKAEGYRSRAAFKLLQLVQRTRLLRRGDRILELGAWPGGWLQVAAQHVGPTGRVVGVDLRPIDRLPEKHVTTLVGDITDVEVQQQVVELCDGAVDVVLSDLAPKLSGVRDRDDAEAQALADCVLQVAERVLKPDGTLVMKRFMGDSLLRDVARLRALFQNLQLTRPQATRKESAEVYAVARGFRGARTAT
jgi:23S rRNA (uridine2552-2'-O)-methyltransferase